MGEQLGLFPAIEVVQMPSGATLRDEGIRRVERHASDDFKAAAVQAIRDLARRKSHFTVDEVWTVRDAWPATPDKRAMGAVMRQAVLDGLLEATQTFIPTTQPACHRRPIRQWRSLVFSPMESSS